MMLLAIILPIFPAIFWHTGICTGKSNGASIRDFGLPEMALIGLACSMIYFIAGFMTHDSAAKTTFGAARVKPICRNSCGQSASHYFQLVALGVLSDLYITINCVVCGSPRAHRGPSGTKCTYSNNCRSRLGGIVSCGPRRTRWLQLIAHIELRCRHFARDLQLEHSSIGYLVAQCL
jgi:hypothetical protein